MTPAQLVALGAVLLAVFLAGLLLGAVGECKLVRRAERELCVPLPDEAVTR